MKTILLHYPDLSYNRVFDPKMRDNFNDPFIFLKERLLLLGYDFKTSDNNPLTDCEWVIFFNAPASKLIRYRDTRNKLKNIKSWLRRLKSGKKRTRDLYKECVESGFRKIALILWEGKAVCPENFSDSLHEKFSYIFTWHDKYVDNIKFFKFYHPLARELPEAPKIPFREKKLLVNISMNKYSSAPQELYSARRRSIRHFEKHFPNDFDLYGVRWNEPLNRRQRLFPWLIEKHSSYRGQVKQKADILPYYKFSLCYENLQGEKGYISEKIFDCLRCHTVPIYWGASNATDFIDKDAFIDRRLFKTDKELAGYISNMSEEEYNKYVQAMERYLQSEKYQLFSSENFADIIIKALKLKNLNA